MLNTKQANEALIKYDLLLNKINKEKRLRQEGIALNITVIKKQGFTEDQLSKIKTFFEELFPECEEERIIKVNIN
jgi:acyl-[acyl carrier protein]--UDP-N-acetylglucosamine O-acyltransferase